MTWPKDINVKTECIRGHSLEDAYLTNHWVWVGKVKRRYTMRLCRPCQKVRSQKQRDKRKVATC